MPDLTSGDVVGLFERVREEESLRSSGGTSHVTYMYCSIVCAQICMYVYMYELYCIVLYV